MNDIKLIDVTIDNLSEYGFCGFKKPSKTDGYQKKREWMIKMFPNGLKFKVLQSLIDGTIGFIEYIPGEYTWRAIDAPGYMVIHCLMSYVKKYQKNGLGILLLDTCYEDAVANSMNGIAVVTSSDSFMADKDIFLKNGYTTVDSAPPKFELLIKKIKKEAGEPKFKGNWDDKISMHSKGLTIFFANQCPMQFKWVSEMVEYAKKKGIEYHVIELNDCIEAQNTPSAYGTFCLIYNGKLITSRPISGGSFAFLMDKLLKGSTKK